MGKPKGKLIDPVDGAAGLIGDVEKVQSVDSIELSDFSPVAQKMASGASDPFTGYHMEKIELPGVHDEKGAPIKKPKTFIVALSPSLSVPQDKSGKGVTIQHPKTKVTNIVDIPSSHSRIVKDASGQNHEIVFDRDIETKDGKNLKYAIIADHLMRAQCIFRTVKGKLRVDDRYVLMDTKQDSRLRELFVRFNYQELKHERSAKKFDSEEESREE